MACPVMAQVSLAGARSSAMRAGNCETCAFVGTWITEAFINFMFNESGNSFLKGTCGIFDRNMFRMETNFCGGQVQRHHHPKPQLPWQVQTVLRLWFCHHAQPFPFDMADGWESQRADVQRDFLKYTGQQILR